MSFTKNTDTQKLIENLKEELEKMPEVKKPDWANFVKTGSGKEKPPAKDDWWHYRASAVLRKVAILGPIGVSKLRTKFGNRKNKGNAPEKFAKASGKIIRVILQQLQEAKLIEKTTKGVHKGRVLTPKGNSLIDKTSISIRKTLNKEAQDGKE